jgi:hypothetical protein
LPTKRLHQAAYPTRSKRPTLIDLWALSVPDGREAPQNGAEGPAPAKPAAPPIPKREPLSDAELVELHIEAQRALALGLSRYAVDVQCELQRTLIRELDLDPFDHGLMAFLLDELHTRAYPAPTRPPRLALDPVESYFTEGGMDPATSKMG